ncbi:MAG: proline dehydrogenase family protein [Candidatus Aminicenantes bacterium]|nr:MAG: proline dehydrogenase family protein [Candidatus Aminicenantes bacterium]
MEDTVNRWALPDWPTTLKWCKKRNSQGIRCTIAVLGEHTKSEEEVRKTLESNITIANAISQENLKASLAVKPTAIGAIFDKTLNQDNLGKILEEAKRQNIIVEIDMEGSPLVEFTLEIAEEFSSQAPLTIALQAYLNRTLEDLKKVIGIGIKVRLVKGAYKGEIEDFRIIQEKFKELFEFLLDCNTPFFVGTHDPELIEWMIEKSSKKKEFIEYGFLKGLADNTKIELAKEGWLISEYIPFGKDKIAYEMRRKHYLQELEKLGRAPAP